MPLKSLEDVIDSNNYFPLTEVNATLGNYLPETNNGKYRRLYKKNKNKNIY